MLQDFLQKALGGFDIPQGAATILAGIARRKMENQYDLLAKTDFFKKLKNQDAATKKVMEVMLNSLMAVLDQSMQEDSFLKKIIKEIALDSGPELSKRIINGDITLKTPADQEMARILLDMNRLNPEALHEFLTWLRSIDPDSKQKLLKTLQNLSINEILSVSQLPPELVEEFLGLFEKPEPIKKTSPLDEMLSPLTSRLEEFVQKKKGNPE